MLQYTSYGRRRTKEDIPNQQNDVFQKVEDGRRNPEERATPDSLEANRRHEGNKPGYLHEWGSISGGLEGLLTFDAGTQLIAPLVESALRVHDVRTVGAQPGGT